METAIRIGAAARGIFHHIGFHATGLVAHFSSAIVAGKLMGLDAAALVSAICVLTILACCIQPGGKSTFHLRLQEMSSSPVSDDSAVAVSCPSHVCIAHSASGKRGRGR